MESEERAGSHLAGLALAALLFALGLAAQWPQLGWGVFGHDSYPLLAASRVEGPGDVPRLLVEPFLEGNFQAAYHRPVQSLLLAGEFAAFGLEPRGYQALQATAWALLGPALFALLGALLARGRAELRPGARRFAAAVPAALVALSPLAHEIAPVASRVHDPLSIAAVACGLALLLHPGLERRGRGAWPAALCLAVAAGLKETGYVAAALGMAALFALGPAGGLAGGLRRVLPSVAALAGLVALRWRALGGVGGLDAPGEPDLGLALRVLVRSLQPQAGPAGPLVAGLLLAAAGLGLIALLASLATEREARRARVTTAGLGLALGIVTAALPALQGRVAAWHSLFPMLGLALLAALALAAACARPRPLALAVAAGLLAPWMGELRWSPLVARSAQWPAAAAELAEFQATLYAAVERAQPGTVVTAPPAPLHAPPATARPAVRRPAVHAPASARAWLELAFPNRELRVVGPLGKLARPTSAVVVALSADPYDRTGPTAELARAVSELTRSHPAAAADLERFRSARERGKARAARTALLSALAAAGPTAESEARAIADYLAWLPDAEGAGAAGELLGSWSAD